MLKLEIPAQLKQDHANLTMHAFSNTLVGSTDLALYNPLSADLHLARLDMNVNYDSVAFARIHADTPLDIPGGNTEVAEGVRLQLNVFGPGETDIVGEITKDATTLVPVPGKDILPEDCNTLAHAEGKCEYKGWFCLGCDGNMTVQVADLELTVRSRPLLTMARTGARANPLPSLARVARLLAGGELPRLRERGHLRHHRLPVAGAGPAQPLYAAAQGQEGGVLGNSVRRGIRER